MDKKTSWKPHFDAKAVALTASELIYDGHFRVYLQTLRFQLFEGGKSPSLKREQITIASSVAVLLYDPRLDTVVMIEQFRVGALGSEQPWLLEIVAGYMDEGETPEAAIRREAQEETQCEIQKLLPVCQCYTSPGGFTEKTWIFCGLIDSAGAGGVHGCQEEHENIKVHVLDAIAVFKLFDQGLLSSASTVIAVQWLQANRRHLQV